MRRLRKSVYGYGEGVIRIEAEMARTQKNKATEYHLGVLKARLAKLRSEVLVCCMVDK